MHMYGRVKTGFFMVCRSTAVVLLLVTNCIYAATLETEVDRETVIDGESVVLYISGTDLSDIPDTSALLPNFRIIHSGVSSNQQVVNGVSTRGFQVRLELQAKNTGSSVIPALTIDGVSSDPIAITVVPRGTPGVEPRDNVFVELSVDNENPYVQEQVILSLDLFDDGKLAGADPTLEGNSDYQVERLPNGSEEIVSRDGVEYRKRSVRYALFPQKSGELVIEELVIPASIRDQSYGGNVFLRNTPTRRIELRTEPYTLQVKPRAALSTSGWWLPVKGLRLDHEWSADIKQAKAGEAYTLTLEILADGATSTQLPEVIVPDVPGLKIYTDTPKFGSQPEQNRLVSLRREKWSVIPNVNGEVTLPEVQIKWWDTVNDAEQVATLPAQQFVVEGGVITPATAPSVTSSQEANSAAEISATETLDQLADPSLAAISSSDSVATDSEASVEPVLNGAVARWWQWLAMVAMAIWALTLFAWWWSVRSTDKQPGSVDEDHRANETQAWRQLRSASQQPDAAVYSAAVLEWARARWPGRSAYNLPSIGKLLGSNSVGDDMQRLDAMRYSGHPNAGHTNDLSLRDIQQRLETAVKSETQTRPIASTNALPQL